MASSSQRTWTSAERRIIAVDDGVDQRLAEEARVVVRHRDPEQADLDLVLHQARPELPLDPLEGLQQRGAVEVVDADLGSLQNLECDFVGRQVFAQGGLAAEDEQARHGRDHPPLLAAEQAQGAIQLLVGQREQRAVAAVARSMLCRSRSRSKGSKSSGEAAGIGSAE